MTWLRVVVFCLVLAVSFGARSDSITTSTYKTLQEAQEALGESQIDQAVVILTELSGEVKEGSLDEAITLQMLGYAEMGRERFSVAVEHLKKALAIGKLPENVKYNVGYMVAQLLAAESKFDEALSFASDWFTTIEAPTAQQYMFMANIYAQLKRYDEAIPYAQNAVTMTDEPRETWYQLLTACHFELEDFPAAVKTLGKMVELWPDNTGYWEQLASVYVIMESEAEALAVLKVAFEAGVLDKETSIRSLIQLSMSREIPEHAARLLERAMQDSLVPTDETFMRMLANAWMSAREDERAIDAFSELATMTETGEPLMRVANLHIKATDWVSAEEALQQAIELGELDSTGKAWLMLGIALCEQQKFEQGFSAFRKARAFDDSKSQARRWLRYAEDMRKQYEWQSTFGS